MVVSGPFCDGGVCVRYYSTSYQTTVTDRRPRIRANSKPTVLRAILDGVAREEKPRIFQGGRDMMLSLAVILVMMFAVVGATGLCSINPEAKDNPAVHEVDAETFLTMEARSTSTPLRLPQTPEGWMPNVARRANVAGTPAAVVGWVTDKDTFIQLTQTSLPLDDAVTGVDANYREVKRTVDVDGVELQLHAGESGDVKDLWAADLGDIRVVLGGTANEEDVTTLLRATMDAQPLPTK